MLHLCCRKHKGDEDAALGLVIEASRNGGVMKYLQLIEGLCTVPPPMQPVADACDRQAFLLLLAHHCTSILLISPDANCTSPVHS